MQIADLELDELASFFARRFDLKLASVEAEVSGALFDQRCRAWRLHLEEVVESGRLSALLHRAQRLHPDDANLREVALLLMEPSRRADTLVGVLLLGSALAAVGLATVVVGMTGAWMMLQPGGRSVEPPSAVAVSVLDSGGVRRVERSASVAHQGRCTSESGGVVGYWYAGAEAPSGSTVILDRMVNVREVFPARDNHWNPRSTITCVLRPGDRIELSLPPVHVDGDRYWIPLVSGDLKRES